MVKKKRSGKHGGGNKQQDIHVECKSWNQKDDGISIMLESNMRVVPNDLGTEFNDTDVKVTVKGNTKWTCKFHQEISKETANVIVKENKIVIQVDKKSKGVKWDSLEIAQDSVIKNPETSPTKDSGEEDKIKKDMKEKDSPKETQPASTATSESDSKSKPSACKSADSQEGPSGNAGNIEDTEPVVKAVEVTPCLASKPRGKKKAPAETITAPPPTEGASSTITRAEDVEIDPSIEGATAAEINPASMDGSGKSENKDEKQTKKGEADAGDLNTDATDFVYPLPLIRHDFFEKGSDVIVVHIYVKQVDRNTISVKFEDRNLSMAFHTRDQRFLMLHGNSPSSTRFEWSILLSDRIIPKNCKYKVTGTTVEITLCKSSSHKKWTSLEAIANKDNNPPAAAATSTNWVPVNKTVPPPAPKLPDILPSASAGASVSNKRVIFDEMNLEKQDSRRGSNRLNERRGFDASLALNAAKLEDLDRDNKRTSNRLNEKRGLEAEMALESSQKPTCMVTPLSKPLSEKPQVVQPGMTGLDNLGNTCFMNSVLQVLANTTELRDYFLEARFQKEINPDNPLGSGGKLAVAFAVLMKILWSGKHYSHAPLKLKNLIAQKASQFTGFAQHDAQEFMAFLLDGLHEDLNRVHDKPYTQTVDSDGRPDEVVANEAWRVHQLRNDSFIVDMFQGQYKSKLVCPVCNKVSITFDPFSILPVPLPKKLRLLPVIFMAKEPHSKPIQYMLRLPRDASVEQLKEAVALKNGVRAANLRVFEAYHSAIHQVFARGASLFSVNPTDLIYVCEVLSEQVTHEPVVELICCQRLMVPKCPPTRCSHCSLPYEEGKTLRRCTRCYRAAYCSQTCQKADWQQRHHNMCRNTPPDFVGQPFIVSLPQSQATFSRLVSMLQTYSRYSVDIFQPPLPDTSSGSPSDSSGSSTDTSGSASPPSTLLDMETIRDEDKDVDTVGVAGQSQESGVDEVDTLELHPDPEGKVKPAVAGTSDAQQSQRTQYVMGRPQEVLQKEQVAFRVRAVSADGTRSGAELEDLGEDPLDFTNIQFIAMDWKNQDKCRPYVMVQSRDLDCDEDESMNVTSLDESNVTSLEQCISLFTEPEVLSPEHAWYCPRCKEHREATKQMSIWRLPDILIIQLKRFSFRNLLWRDKIDKLVHYPTRGLDMSQYFIGSQCVDASKAIYDLYGVVNHHGGILGGHYTSFVRCQDLQNPVQDEIGWRLCDDSMVSLTREKQVLTKAGYVLFYRRRCLVVDPEAPVPSQTDCSDDDEDEFLDVEPASEFVADTSMMGQVLPSMPDLQGGGDSPGIPTVVSAMDDMETEPLLGGHEHSTFLTRHKMMDYENPPIEGSCSYTDMDAVD